MGLFRVLGNLQGLCGLFVALSPPGPPWKSKKYIPRTSMGMTESFFFGVTESVDTGVFIPDIKDIYMPKCFIEGQFSPFFRAFFADDVIVDRHWALFALHPSKSGSTKNPIPRPGWT
jgi:hypothetical protein